MLIRTLFIIIAFTLLACTTLTLVNAQSVASAPKSNTFSYICEVLGDSYLCTLNVPNGDNVDKLFMRKLGRRLIGYESFPCMLHKHIIDLETKAYKVEIKRTCKDGGI